MLSTASWLMLSLRSRIFCWVCSCCSWSVYIQPDQLLLCTWCCENWSAAALLSCFKATAGLHCIQGKPEWTARQNTQGLKQDYLLTPIYFSSRECHGSPKPDLQSHSHHLHVHIGLAAPAAPLPPLQVQPGQPPCCTARAARPVQPQRPHCLSSSQRQSPYTKTKMCVGTSPTWFLRLIAQRSVQTVPCARQWCLFCASVAAGFALLTLSIKT